MSYWVYLLNKDGKPYQVESFLDGGTCCLGGTTETELNITYNYGKHMRMVLGEGGLRCLHNKKAIDVKELLRSAVEKLGTDRSNDYWEPTEGNAGAVLAHLFSWAEQYPEGVFKVS
jgi:hypothetical protein